jgi:MFS family permease
MGGFVFYGLGIGMGYYPILKTTWKYFPEKKGFLTGLILCVFGLCPFVFTSIADAVINPEGLPANEKGIFDDDKIAIKMKDFSLIMTITMAVCGVLSQLLMFPLDNIVSTDNNQVVVEDDNKPKDAIETNVSNEIYASEKYGKDTNKENEEENKKVVVNEPFMQAFKSLRFHLFNFMSVGTLFFGYFSTNTSRAFGTIKLKEYEKELQIMSKVCGLLNGAFRIAWGFVYDALGFKIPYSIVTSLQILVSATFYFSANYIWSYYITNILENVVFSGHGTIAPPIISKIFGMKNTVTLIGVTGYYIGTAGFIGALCAKLIIKDEYDFLIVYLIGCGFAVVGFVICLMTKEDKFQYSTVGYENKDLDSNALTNELVKPSIGSTSE